MRRLSKSLALSAAIVIAGCMAAGCGSTAKNAIGSLPTRSAGASPSPSASSSPSPSASISPSPSVTAPSTGQPSATHSATPAQAAQPSSSPAPGTTSASGLIWLWILLGAILLIGVILWIARARGRSAAAAGWQSRVAAVLTLVALSGALRSIAVLLLGLAGLAVTSAAAWWFLAHRGVLRWLAFAVLIAAPVFVIVMYVAAGLLGEIVVAVVLAAAAVAAGRSALTGDRMSAGPREYAAAAQRQPFVIMNPRSGGGKVGKFGLGDKAAALGAEVAVLEGPGVVDVAALARQAVGRGADLLGVAGGDGTQALVAGIAAGRDVPMMVISAGTRNHFALDLGLDRDDPSRCLDALTDGVELRIDLGLIGDRTFVNNASFGAYAQVVQSPAYRDDKSGTALQLLPDLLSGHQGAHLVVRVDGRVVLDGPQAVLVSNNPYETGDIAGLGRRARLDQGVLGVVGVKVDNAVQAVGLLRRPQRSRSLTVLTAREVVIDADQPQIPVGIDGESVLMPTPVRCTIRPLSLRVQVPRGRPGVPEPRRPMDWAQLRRLALTFARAARGGEAAR
jgi:diacylglycerol kinase family enzyme